jgi:putative acetyltransferase
MKTEVRCDDWHFPIDNFNCSDEFSVKNFICENLEEFDQEHKMLVSTFRRIRNLNMSYLAKGSILYKIGSPVVDSPIACIGVGPLHGLSYSDRIGEIRDFAVDKDFRCLGLGRQLLAKAIESARNMSYKRLYLETTKQMIVARNLFERFGFRAVQAVPENGKEDSCTPSYYLLEKL